MKSIEELARELVNKIILVHDDPAFIHVWHCAHNLLGPYAGPTYTDEFTALKSALEKPVEKEPEWPKYFQPNHGDILRFDGESQRGIWEDGTPSLAWHYGRVIGSQNFKPIPTAEALAIIEKAKIK